MGLLRWRFVDVVWGLTLGVVLRLAHGLLFVAPDTSFPSAASLSGAHALDWIATEAVPIGLLAPIAEEFLFRGVILVGLYAILARRLGSLAAAVSASLLSAGLFVLTHSSFAALSGADVTQLLAIGLINAALVILTGRIWAALVVHVVYKRKLASPRGGRLRIRLSRIETGEARAFAETDYFCVSGSAEKRITATDCQMQANTIPAHTPTRAPLVPQNGDRTATRNKPRGEHTAMERFACARFFCAARQAKLTAFCVRNRPTNAPINAEVATLGGIDPAANQCTSTETRGTSKPRQQLLRSMPSGALLLLSSLRCAARLGAPTPEGPT